MIPYARQNVDKRDIREVVRVLRSAWLTQGPMIERFEEAFAKYCGAKYAVAVSSGTAGLHLASLAAGIRPGDEIITTPLSFVATSNALLYCGARPVFVDVSSRTLGPDKSRVKNAVSQKTKGILNVHFGGQPNVLGASVIFSSRKDFARVDDACHALGAEVKTQNQWKKMGGLPETDMSVFSFHPVKHITTGEGGMVTTSRKDFYEKLRLLRSHGLEREPRRFHDKKNSKNPWHYEMQVLGFNYRITDIQCALGLSQLKKIGANVSRRRSLAALYDWEFEGISGLRTPEKVDGTRSSYHLYALRIDFKRFGFSRAQFMRDLRKEGIATQVHYITITQQPFYKRHGYAQRMPETDSYYEQALSIPMYGVLRTGEAKKVARCIKKRLKNHGRVA